MKMVNYTEEGLAKLCLKTVPMSPTMMRGINMIKSKVAKLRNVLEETCALADNPLYQGSPSAMLLLERLNVMKNNLGKGHSK